MYPLPEGVGAPWEEPLGCTPRGLSGYPAHQSGMFGLIWETRRDSVSLPVSSISTPPTPVFSSPLLPLSPSLIPLSHPPFPSSPHLSLSGEVLDENPHCSWCPHQHPQSRSSFLTHLMEKKDLGCCGQGGGRCLDFLIFVVSQHSGILKSSFLGRNILGSNQWDLSRSLPNLSPSLCSSRSLSGAPMPPRRSCHKPRTNRLYSFCIHFNYIATY